jgi:Type IX secretion system protein PorV
MKKVTLTLVALVLAVVFLVNDAHAQSTSNVVTTAVPFLRISPDARAGGMADAGIATSSDAYRNIAKTSFSSSSSNVGVTYTPWLQELGLNDVYMINAGGFYKLDDQQGLTSSLRYFSLGTIQNTDNSGTQLGQFRPHEFAFDLGYSRKLSNKFAIGVALRYISSNLATGVSVQGSQSAQTGTAVAGDIHVFHTKLDQKGEGLNYGITLSNLGSKISYFKDAADKNYLPATIAAGAAYTKVYDADNKVTFTLQLSKLLVPTPPNDTSASAVTEYNSESVVSSWFNSFSAPGGFSEEMKQVDISTGIEYGYQDQFFLRAGYFYENPTEGDRQYFTAGAGLKYTTFTLNFSYLIPAGNGITRSPLSNTLRFSMLFDLDNSAQPAAVATPTAAPATE